MDNFRGFNILIFLAFFLLNSGLYFAQAQSDLNRPLRTIKPEAPVITSHSAVHASLQDSGSLFSDDDSLSASYSSFYIPNTAFIAPRTLISPPRSSTPANSLITDKALEHALTKQFIAQYSSANGLATLNATMERGRIYLPFIREEIARRGLPPELVYLPIIESGFVITARSSSGAVGLWQFMLNSISPYNMKVTDLLDERRDFIKSTRGALQKLEDEYLRLGNWELTLAAYNSGFYAVTRAVQTGGTSDYWELHRKNLLRPETMNFVPRLTAVAYVLSKPRQYGINVWQEGFEWAAIPLQRQVSIDIVAHETGIERDLLRRLNAELVYGITPAGSGHLLKVPVTHLDAVNTLLQRTDMQLIRYYYHIVRSGDTLWAMSRHYGASISMIEQHNPGISNRYLRIGETIIIPAFTDVAPMPQQGTSGGNQTAGGAGSIAGSTHVVQRGESFWAISRIYGIDPQALAEANGMSLNQILHEGRVLRLPIIE